MLWTLFIVLLVLWLVGQVGEWTGDKDAQAEGAAKQVEGKVQNAWGKTKDAVRDAAEKVKRDNKTESEREREDKEDVA